MTEASPENKGSLNVYVSWQNLRFEVPDPDDKNAKKTILHDLNGHVLPGELIAVIGPSGSGKSSFLNCVAGRNSRGVTGDLLFNGVPRPTNFARFTGYVVQDDLYLESLTVKETLTFAADLKLPSTMSKAERRLRVRDIMEELDLVKCQDTQIGTIGKGISGGERRRLAIGLEIINEPALLLLDEPTTGLDSASSLMVGRILKRLVKKGITVLCTIHQPRYALATMFDKLYFLAKGKEIYFGPTIPHCLSFFENCGYKCPPFTNPADFLLDLVNTAIEDNVSNEEMSGEKYGSSSDLANETTNLIKEDETLAETKKDDNNVEMVETQAESDNNGGNAGGDTGGGDDNDANESGRVNMAKDDATSDNKNTVTEEEKNNNETQDATKKEDKVDKNDNADDNGSDEDSDGFLKDMLDYASDDENHEIDQEMVQKHMIEKSKDFDKEKEKEQVQEKEKEKETETEVPKDKNNDTNDNVETGGTTVAGDENEKKETSPDVVKKQQVPTNRDEVINHLVSSYAKSEYREKALDFTIPENEKGNIVFNTIAKEFYITPWYNQFRVILLRSFLHKAREPIALTTQAFNATVIPLIFGSMYWQMDNSQQGSQDRISAISIVVIMLSFFAYDILLLFPVERDIFNRENAAGMYRPSMFYFGRSLAEMPQHIILMGLMATITYWMYGLQNDAGKFANWFILFELTGICSASLLLSFGAFAANLEQSNLLATFFLLLFMLFDGNWISIKKIPVYWKWIQHISLFAYGTQGMIINEYKGLDFKCTDNEILYQECFALTGDDVLDPRGLDDKSVGGCMLYLVLLTIAFRVIAFLGVLFMFRPKPPSQILSELFGR